MEPKTYDLISSPFTANQTGIDAFLNNYVITIDYTNNTYTIINNATGQPAIFDTNIVTDGYYIGAEFIPENAAVWQLTITDTLNDVLQNIDGPRDYTTAGIPWSKERFEEIFWGILPEPTTQNIDCDSPGISCDLTIQISQLESNYSTVGNGEVGTQIDASVGYSWSMTGTIQGIANGIPFSQDINQTEAWTYTWLWERIN